ncbi:MAG: hypothetical protein H5T96_09265 [Tissierellales bacterium]|nr:hypothetical protein [Tissierellales bacterium]
MINPWTGKESNIFSVLKGNIDKGFIRIPYLTKEQIESEGWFVTKEENFLRGTHPIEVDVKLTYSKSDKWLWLQIPGTIITEDLNKIPYDAGMYVGFCPSINEFRKICKLLGL